MFHRSRIRHWTCSKFADFIRGTKKPFALEWNEWTNWHKEAKNKHPIRYWIAESFLKNLQNFVSFPGDVYSVVQNYYENRFVSKTHFLKTGLKPGKYHELDDRFLYGLFNELVEFVEQEVAYKHKCFSEKKYVFKKGRCPEAGLDYLKWASRLKNNKQPTPQAVSAKKIIKLYNWWKKRPNRPDPMEVSGWSKHCDEKDGDDFLFESKKSDETKKILLKMYNLEEKYDKEDENMLIELIKVRKNLWT